MSGDIAASTKVAESALRAQSLRMRVIAENIANADSLSPEPGGDPYRRRVVTFGTRVDRETGARTVEAGRIAEAAGAFDRRHQPGHPSAGADGYVKVPNVDALIEGADMRSAQRAFEANLNVIEANRGLLSKTIDLLK